MNPCEMGLRCPYCIHCEDGDGCIYPYAVGVLPERGTFGLIGEADCPLVEAGSDMERFLSLASDYREGEWENVMRRLSVHLDRPYDDQWMRHEIRMTAIRQALRWYWEEDGWKEWRSGCDDDVLVRHALKELIEAAMECQADHDGELEKQEWDWLSDIILTATELRDREVRG